MALTIEKLRKAREILKESSRDIPDKFHFVYCRESGVWVEVRTRSDGSQYIVNDGAEISFELVEEKAAQHES